MRFRAPSRTPSPSPVRGKPRSRPRKSYAFGVPPDSSDEDSYSESDSDAVSVSSSSSSSSDYSDLGKAPSVRLRASLRTSSEQRYIEETVAAIRLRTRHHDPYEEWERQTRRDAFRTARKEISETQAHLLDEIDQTHAQEKKELAALYEKQLAEVQTQLNTFKLQQENEEAKLREGWKARDRMIWERIESVIKLEEDKVAKKLEEERKAQEEKERKRKEEEERKRLAEEKRKEEEERKAKEEEKKRKDEEDARQAEEEKRSKAEEEERQAVEEEKLKKERQEAEGEQRSGLGLSTAEEDWREARSNLLTLKAESMRFVKSNKEAKAEWSKYRRQITPKVGQLTNDADSINRISLQLLNIMKPTKPHHERIYIALLSSLSKAILEQAETEVTAEKRSAIPLSQVTVNLFSVLDSFPEIFFAKLVQRAGGWVIPVVIPQTDHDGRPWADEQERNKIMGYRKSATSDNLETPIEYSMRVSGIMRLYFHILMIPPLERPAYKMFQLPRFWVWFARLMGEKGLLETVAAPQLIYTGLDVMGTQAKAIWGIQWVKILALIYEGVTVGLGNGKLIGGESAEGSVNRTRARMEVERIMAER
ncbi:GLE1-like protein-domain-containing protein [Crucibulum laeve]|uniref:mRNA export factor GLE1 n=1 Tax=Crucibulum laeve TaxID=68775 RepID=A0A5C3M587_9AGAR|nr:GLE1-like protein-domain-containing protein [Crucibulum laeve]